MNRYFVATVLMASITSVMDGRAVAADLFAQGFNGILYRFDTETSAVTPIGFNSLTGNVALSFEQDGTLFAFDNATQRLFTLNTNTGAYTLTGTPGPQVDNAEAMSFDLNGSLLVAESGIARTKIWQLDTTTAAPSLVGDTSGVALDFDGLTAAPVDLVVPGIGNVSAGTLFAVDSGALYIIDRNTLVVTSVGATNGSETLAFAPDGSLFTMNDKDVWEIDVATLSETKIGSLPIAALGTAVDPRSFIPEPATLALLVLALVIPIRSRQPSRATVTNIR